MQVRNDSGETIPAFAIMRTTGVVLVKQEAIVKVEKPNTYGGREGCYLVNGPYPIAADGYGESQSGRLLSLYFDTADATTPAYGEEWGPVSGSWKAKRYVPGFRIVGLADDDSPIVLAQFAPMRTVLVKTDASTAHDRGSSGTCTVYHGNTPGSETASSYTITAWNRFADLPVSRWARAVPVADDDFDLISGEGC